MAKGSFLVGGAMGAVVAAALGAVVGCGDSFGGTDCQASRTCSTAPDDSGAGGARDGTTPVASGGGGDVPASSDASAGGAPANSDATVGGATAGGDASEGGATADAGCKIAADCSNGNPDDGEELCDHGTCLAGNPPPTIVSFSPDSDTSGVEPDTSVVIEFNEPLDPKTVTSSSIQLLDGSTAVPGQVSYADNKVTFTPSEPLSLLAPYKIAIGTGVTDEQGAALSKAGSSTFSIRDGAWSTIDVAKGRLNQASDSLAMSAAGNVLVAWSGTGAATYCPTSARWFLRGKPLSPTTLFAHDGQSECIGVSVAVNDAGVGAVVWTSSDALTSPIVRQFRSGAWLEAPKKPQSTYDFSAYPRVAVTADGVVTLLDHSAQGGSTAWLSDASGEWPMAGEPVGTGVTLGRSSIAFDEHGNGLALWANGTQQTNGIERISVSRLMAASGKWGTADDLPGSVTSLTSTQGQRGDPVVAMDSAGDALALWVDASPYQPRLMASRYLQASGWGTPEAISGAANVKVLREAPALVFDGTDFVAAWTAEETAKQHTYTARYRLKTGWELYEKHQPSAADGTSALKMPQLASDGRGNLVLVFATGAGPAYTLVSQRHAGGQWGPITAIPDATISDPFFESGNPLRMAGSPNGLAAVMWEDKDASNYVTAVHLANFF